MIKGANKMKYYITGDCHGNFRKIEYFINLYHTSVEDIMIILGDVGLNYYLGRKDNKNKANISKLPITLFCIHGNHEARPSTIDTYKEKEWHGGVVYFEEEFPNILFAKDGEVYDFDGKKAIVLGGAYSVDKEYRLSIGNAWFPDEQPSAEIKQYVWQQLEKNNYKVDYVLSHTCPLEFEPTELFLDFIDQSRVDKTTENWLSDIRSKLTYSKWYFGHYHGNKQYASAEMLYEAIKELDGDRYLLKIGIPQYRRKQEVLFCKEKRECFGIIKVVDDYGCKEVLDEVSYDIYGYYTEDASEKIMFKHIRESDIKIVIEE